MRWLADLKFRAAVVTIAAIALVGVAIGPPHGAGAFKVAQPIVSFWLPVVNTDSACASKVYRVDPDGTTWCYVVIYP